MTAKTKSIMSGCIILVLVIGTLNSIYKNDKLPGLRFFFGTGVLWLFLIGLGEFEEEVSKNIAIAIAVFTVLGEGGGMLNHFLGQQGVNHLDTRPVDRPEQTKLNTIGPSTGEQLQSATVTRRQGGINATSGTEYVAPVKPVIPNAVTIEYI